MPATSATPTPLPSGVSPPLTTDNDDNHGGLVVVITSLSLVFVLSSLAARIYSSLQRRMLQRDDLLFAILVVGFGNGADSSGALAGSSGVGHADRIYIACEQADAQGKSCARLPRALPVLTMGQTVYAADLLSILVLGCSKITSSLFYETLFSQMRLQLIRGILGVTIAWTILSVSILAVRCSDTPWYDISAAECSGLLPRWITITVIDIVTEILLFVYAGLAIHKVRISLQKKLVVGVTLESRVLLIPLAAIHLYYVSKQINSDDPILLGAYATITTEIYIAISVVSLISAFLKSFIAVYEDKHGLSYTDGTSGSRSKTKQYGSANIAASNKLGPQSSASADRPRGWEREEDPIVDPVDGRGLQILKTVQLDVRDESIELADQGTTSASPPR
ncbi:uncharacterized protein N7482_009991 [Penicillium canariense]|uniref:Rhodopsin domain-containing protein n=1 Tax=Penicillium canariense TaxID=189055 RepID=A0A9W9HNK5_9EURO|nr:uncharacterized protein N7482_009991 [Penicillium canariense]KAJ5153513.1 hypothetical protein N7482_009991 [Penicillium canariense]